MAWTSRVAYMNPLCASGVVLLQQLVDMTVVFEYIPQAHSVIATFDMDIGSVAREVLTPTRPVYHVIEFFAAISGCDDDRIVERPPCRFEYIEAQMNEVGDTARIRHIVNMQQFGCIGFDEFGEHKML